MDSMGLTMIPIIPIVVSRRTNQAPQSRMIMVTGMAATVSANSAVPPAETRTRNCTVKPRKKKKSNFNRAM